MGKWISCKNRYPPEGEEVLIFSPGRPVTGGRLVLERGVPLGWDVFDWHDNELFYNWVEVTHWMTPPPLPKNPKMNV